MNIEADEFAKQSVNSPEPLISALRKLYVENLNHPIPHRVMASFHYSHPTLPEREKGSFGSVVGGFLIQGVTMKPIMEDQCHAHPDQIHEQISSGRKSFGNERLCKFVEARIRKCDERRRVPE